MHYSNVDTFENRRGVINCYTGTTDASEMTVQGTPAHMVTIQPKEVLKLCTLFWLKSILRTIRQSWKKERFSWRLEIAHEHMGQHRAKELWGRQLYFTSQLVSELADSRLEAGWFWPRVKCCFLAHGMWSSQRTLVSCCFPSVPPVHEVTKSSPGRYSL